MLIKRILIAGAFLLALNSSASSQSADRLVGNTLKMTWGDGAKSYVYFSANGTILFGSAGSSFGYALGRGKDVCSTYSAVKGYKDQVCGTYELSGDRLTFQYSGTNTSRYGVIPVSGSYSFTIAGDSCSGSSSGTTTGTVKTCTLVKGRSF